jgi:hypothetical protein
MRVSHLRRLWWLVALVCLALALLSVSSLAEGSAAAATAGNAVAAASSGRINAEVPSTAVPKASSSYPATSRVIGAALRANLLPALRDIAHGLIRSMRKGQTAASQVEKVVSTVTSKRGAARAPLNRLIHSLWDKPVNGVHTKPLPRPLEARVRVAANMLVRALERDWNIVVKSYLNTFVSKARDCADPNGKCSEGYGRELDTTSAEKLLTWKDQDFAKAFQKAIKKNGGKAFVQAVIARFLRYYLQLDLHANNANGAGSFPGQYIISSMAQAGVQNRQSSRPAPRF